MNKSKMATAMLSFAFGVAVASVFIIAVAFSVYVMVGYIIPSSLILLVSMTGVAPDESVMDTVFVLGMPALFLIGLYLAAVLKAIRYFYATAIRCYTGTSKWISAKLSKKGM